ncbi:hypothetical protein MJ585_11025 [Klebsiella pneumoniae]|nr:hypothetical protein MJ585_11025 [Klebsiella pneumoniae]
MVFSISARRCSIQTCFRMRNMEGKIDRPEEYADTPPRDQLPREDRDRCLVVLSRQDEALDSQRSADLP